MIAAPQATAIRFMLAAFGCALPAFAQPAPVQTVPPLSKPAAEPAPKRPPHELVREANELLREGEAQQAIPLYDEAAELAPEAREIAFSEGLARYELGEYDEARAAFLKAMRGDADRTAIDAEYSLATIDHAEALAQSDDPQAAIESLESAMRGYQSVLEKDPAFAQAQRSNRKAAAMRRKLKQIQQQQQQQQQQNENSDEKNEENEQQDSQQQNQSDQQQGQENQDSQDEQQQQQDSENSDQQQDQSQQQNQDQQDSQSRDQQQQSDQKDAQQQEQQQNQQKDEQQDQQQDEQEQKQDDQQQQSASEQQQAAAQQDHSREQSERRLREMMEAIRDRKKQRKPVVVPVPVRPADKDW